MTFQEKSLWAYGFASLVIPAVYLTWLARKLADTADVADISYVCALVWAIGAGIVVNMVGNTLVRGSNLSKADKSDRRDREIRVRGDAVNFIVFSILVVVPFILAMRDAETFWIANSIYVAYVLTAVIGVVIKAVLYRKGI
jgi:hypothetical protein